MRGVHGAACWRVLDDGWWRVRLVQLCVPIAAALAKAAPAKAAAAAACAAAACAAAACAAAACAAAACAAAACAAAALTAPSQPAAAAQSLAAARPAAVAEPADGCDICMRSALGAGSQRRARGLHRARCGQHHCRLLPLHLHGRLERARLLCRAGRRPGSRSAPSVPAGARQPHGASGGA
jgi:hypothetical protein